MYACIGALPTGARHREVLAQEGLCPECARENRPRAPRPTHVIFKFTVSLKRGESLEQQCGILRVRDVRWGERDSKHFGEALLYGQEPHVQRGIVGAGTPVFGTLGVCEIQLLSLWQELLGLGFVLQDVHLERARDNKKDVLVMSLAQGEETPFPSSNARDEVIKLLAATWQWVHVWANPPKVDATVPHTLICISMMQDPKNPKALQFRDGLWGV